jgi:hypothetical protein
MRPSICLSPRCARPPSCGGPSSNALKKEKVNWGWIIMNIAPGQLGIAIWSTFFLGYILCCDFESNLKKTPALTLPQAQRLIAATFPLNSLTLNGAIEIVKYHTQRNYVAYISHRKKAVAKAKVLNMKLSL